MLTNHLAEHQKLSNMQKIKKEIYQFWIKNGQKARFCYYSEIILPILTSKSPVI